MKKKNKKNQIRMRFSTILLCFLCFLTISLCAAPTLHAQDTVIIAGQTKIIDYTVTGTGILRIVGTANLLTGASAQYIYVQKEGTLNMYSGTITIGGFINVSPDANSITIYGTEFAVSNGTILSDGNWTLEGFGTLTGYYGDTSPINLLILSDIDIPIHLQPPPSGGPITIDIKPGGNPNNINLKSKGVVPVAVLTTGDFDAGTIDPETVLFAGAEPERWTLCDVDVDGDEDMLFHFKTHKLVKSDNNPDGLDENSTKATLTAKLIGTMISAMTTETTDGEVIQGTDTVRILSQKKK